MYKSKKVLALLLAMIMVTVVFAGCAISKTTEDSGAATTPKESKPVEEGSYFPLKEPVEISVFGQGYWNPIDAPIAYQDMLKKLNIKVKWETPFEGFTEKKDIALATKNIPDLMWVSAADSLKYGPMGAFEELSQYVDKMPNVKKWLETYDAYKYAFMSAEGKFWGLPKYTNADQNTPFWAYNKEKFDEWGLAEPKNLDELYETAKVIKAKDPNRYFPIVGWVQQPQTDFYTVLKSVCNSMGIGDDLDINFYVKEDVYRYTPLHPKFKDAVLYVKKLYDEKLISPDYLTIDERKSRAYWSEWEGGGDPYAQFTGFIGSMSLSAVQSFQRWYEDEAKGLREKQRGSFQYMILGDEVSMANVNPIADNTGNTVCIGSKSAKDPKKLDLLLHLIDWMYSDEAKLLFNYGREGWHYDMVDGKPVIKPLFISNTPEYASVYFKGTPVRDRIEAAGWDYKKVSMDDQLQIWGFYAAYIFMPFNQFDDYYANVTRYPAGFTPQVRELTEKLKKNATILGKRPLPFDNEQNKKRIDLSVAAHDYCLQEVDKFIMGKRPMGEWDAFINELKAKGAAELETLYNSVYSYQVKK